MNFVVDIGNTLQKFALFDSDDNLIFVKAVDEISIDEIALLFKSRRLKTRLFRLLPNSILNWLIFSKRIAIVSSLTKN